MKQTKFVSKPPPYLRSFPVFSERLKRFPGGYAPFLISRGAVKKVPRTFLILNKVSEWFAAGWVAEFAEGFGFDLADAFAGHIEDLAHSFQGAHFAII